MADLFVEGNWNEDMVHDVLGRVWLFRITVTNIDFLFTKFYFYFKNKLEQIYKNWDF